jgi:hypothetical protein
MRVIHLWIVRYLNIQPWQMQSYRYVIQVTLMMVTMTPLYNHFAPHDVRRESRKTLQQRLASLANCL